MGAGRSQDADEEQTPVAPYGRLNPVRVAALPSDRDAVRHEGQPTASTSKYECSYCGKGFNRPSSLKVYPGAFLHINTISFHFLDTSEPTYRGKT